MREPDDTPDETLDDTPRDAAADVARDPTSGAATGLGRDGWATMDDGVRLHYVERGDGPLVVLLHGFPQYWGAWRHQLVALADAGFRVVAPDLRGYNLSDKPASIEAYRASRLAWDVAELIDHVGDGRAHVVGHDWGGAIAWDVARRHPERVDRLAILNAPHPRRLARVLRETTQVLRSWYVMFFQLPWLPERLLSAGDHAILADVLRYAPARRGAFDEAEIARHRVAWRRERAITSMLAYYRAAMQVSSRHGARHRDPIGAPTLVLWGMRDRYLHESLCEGLAEWATDVHVVRFAEASHWLMEDEPDRVNAELIGFLGASDQSRL
jgi:pimeloyl-ACP methyl ester carboxylesterase